MTPLEFSVVFSFGLAGGLHCAQMCGPLVLAYSLPLRGGAMRAHLAYNAGRIATYTLLGAVAGAVGQAIRLPGTPPSAARRGCQFAREIGADDARA